MPLLIRILCLLVYFIALVSSEIVTCNHNTPVCECMDTSAEVCEFQFDIEMLRTFTRYVLDTNGDSRGTAGSVWYINNGQWQPVNPQDILCGTTIDDKRCTEPFGVDGYTFRSFIAVNGRIPGPTLIVSEGQLVQVTVTNRLSSESISIHWHGMHQRNSNWMDGVEHLTQCGIPPGVSFTYIFEAAQYGTHWYHSHSGAQRTDGLFGALIVKENSVMHMDKLKNELGINDIIDIPDNHTLTFLDWQKKNSLELFTQIHSGIRYFDVEKASDLTEQGAVTDRTYSSDNAEIGPVPYWSGIINGRGKHIDADYIDSSLHDFKVKASNTYRFRLIGAQSLYAYRFSIEEHNLTVIATDGQFIKPIEVDYIIFHSGERYDVLVKTKDATELTTQYFMIRAVTLNFTASSGYMEEESAEAILNYNDNSPPSSQYSSIAARSLTISERCSSYRCKALNCPFKLFPEDHNIECIHIHQLELLSENPRDIPDIATNSNSRLFFNFAFEGTRRTSAINARNLKLPPGALAMLNEAELNDIKNKEYCLELEDDSTCDRVNNEDVISSDCYCTHVIDVEADRSIELVLSATGPNYNDVSKDSSNFLFAHPVHLHGHYFHVVDIKFGTTNEVTGKLEAGHSEHIDCGGNTLCTNPSWKVGMDYNTRNDNNLKDVISRAPLKDTLLIPAGGYAVVYFKADNPGWWFLHCHIEVHQLEGMGVIINEKGFKTPPPEKMNKCGNFPFTSDEFKAAISATVTPPNSITPTITVTPTKNDNRVGEFYLWGTIGFGITAGTFLITILCLLCCIACLCRQIGKLSKDTNRNNEIKMNPIKNMPKQTYAARMPSGVMIQTSSNQRYNVQTTEVSPTKKVTRQTYTTTAPGVAIQTSMNQGFGSQASKISVAM